MPQVARDELGRARGERFRRIIDASAAGRAGTPDQVGGVGTLLMAPDGGVTAAWWYGELVSAT
ncbi:hypothetical protein HNP47_000008 [Brevundimonas vesicularis]|uniref:Uncharacterized protein n=1 Tax=Brevundimonas vesicularis TaxID=41276 RepID=A0A7W9L487_BREVE|nr:hypothetical protein [Brevundimonas vesicularis]MBB5770039.1 hypothetical protein [Brevundimonas vesicularis]